jgi:beta-lactam-binding protein with PASTA domain
MVDPETIIDGRYRVLSRLGSGGMADVYLAEDQLLGRQVAVKLLHPHFAEDQEFVERFRREASSAAALSHPNIVGIFDRGEWNATYYIAMEYVAGRTLKAIVREDGPLDPAAAIDIVIQILRAARFAHKRGVIHRDLKPHNVILDEEGRARVTDFGIARAGASDMTLTGSIMGTAQYLSPEQAQGHAVSSGSDLYSVGVILYELLTGVVPFEGETAVAIAFKQVSAVPRPPSELNAALPLSLDALVLRALAKDPAHRYADAEEFIAVLQHERQALALHAPAVVGPTLLQGSPPDAPLPQEGEGALLVAPAAPFEQDGPPAGDRRRRWLWALAAALLAAAAVLALLLLQPGGKVRVPAVVGQSEQTADGALRRAGLTPDPSSSSSSVPAGLVLSQSPPAGNLVGKGAHVRIVISRGLGTARVPGVEGLTAAQALARLRRAGFKPTTRAQNSATVAQGRAIGTDPASGLVIQSGSPVTVLLSSGAPPVSVPSVTGQSQKAAEAALTAAGLSVGTITKQVSTSQAPGTVLAQSPSSGASLPPAGKVDLTVAQAPKEVAVPNVVGETREQAVAKLHGAGFSVKTVTAPASEEAKVGEVLAQSPAAGAKARKGASVTITVGAQATPTTPATTPTKTTPPAPPAPPAAQVEHP